MLHLDPDPGGVKSKREECSSRSPTTPTQNVWQTQEMKKFSISAEPGVL